MTALRAKIEDAKITGVITINHPTDGRLVAIDITDTRIDDVVKQPATKRALATARRNFRERDEEAMRGQELL